MSLGDVNGARVLLVDNYDSFTYNLYQALVVLGAEVTVRRNDEITVAEARALAPTHLVISPGPGRPEDAGVSIEMLRAFIGTIPVLGVCLGHQALGVVMGGTVTRAPRQMHGKSSQVWHDGKGLYAGITNPMDVARYHSLIVLADTLPADMVVDGYTDQGEVMSMHHARFPVFGVQYHPESVLTPRGEDLLRNFLRSAA